MKSSQKTPREIADKYAIGSCRDDLEYEIEAAINYAVALVTGIPPGPADPPGPVPRRVA